MVVWTVYVNGKADLSYDKHSVAVKRANFLVSLGFLDIGISGKKPDGTPVFYAQDYSTKTH